MTSPRSDRKYSIQCSATANTKRSISTVIRQLSPGSLSCPGFVFPFHPDQFRNIQQVVQGIGPVPELMLFPVSLRHRQEQEFVNVRAGQGDVAAGALSGPDCPPPKKPDRLQAIPSSRSFMQVGVSCRISG